MKNIKRKVVAALLGIAAAVGLTFTTAVPAQAFTTFAVWQQCDTWQLHNRLSIQNQSGATVYFNVYQNGTGRFLARGSVANGYSTAFNTGYYSVTYYFYGNGSLNWWYQRTCYRP